MKTYIAGQVVNRLCSHDIIDYGLKLNWRVGLGDRMVGPNLILFWEIVSGFQAFQY